MSGPRGLLKKPTFREKIEKRENSTNKDFYYWDARCGDVPGQRQVSIKNRLKER